MCSWYQIQASGLIGSPTEPSSRRRRQVVALRVLGAPLHVGPDRRRRGVEDVDLVALDDLPPAVLVREVRRALVHDAGRAVAERPVDDVAVPGHPADVGGAPVDRVGLDVEDVVVRGRDADEVAARRVRDPLRLGGRARGVEQVEEVLGVHRLARARRSRRSASSCHQRSRPSVIGTSPPVRRRTMQLRDARRGGHRLVGDLLQRRPCSRGARPRPG